MDDRGARAVANLVNNGGSILDLAAAHDTSYADLFDRIKPWLRPDIYSGRYDRKVADADVVAARLDYTNGTATLPDIADRYGLDRSTATKMIHGDSYRNLPHPAPRVHPPGVCSVTGCGRPTKAQGWCAAHYHRARRNGGDPQAHIPIWG